MNDTSSQKKDLHETAQAFATGVQQKISKLLAELTPDLAEETGIIKNQGLLDLTGATGLQDLASIKALRDIGLILVPEPLMAALVKIPQSGVGAIVPIPSLGDGRVRVMAGQVKLAGDAFAGQEQINDMVVLAGQVVFTSVVQECRVRGLVVAGQLCAPQGSEAALSKAIVRMSGQSIYFPASAEPRVMLGDQQLSELYFQSLPKPLVLVLIGEVTLDDDLTAGTFREKVAGLVVIGKLVCSAAIKPIAQALCSDCVGSIESR